MCSTECPTERNRLGGIDAATISWAGTDTVLTYHAGYLAHPDAVPPSLSLPMRIQPHAGAVVENWLDGLLPDLAADRERWRASVGAASVDPFDLLATPLRASGVSVTRYNADELRSGQPLSRIAVEVTRLVGVRLFSEDAATLAREAELVEARLAVLPQRVRRRQVDDEF